MEKGAPVCVYMGVLLGRAQVPNVRVALALALALVLGIGNSHSIVVCIGAGGD